MDNKNPKLEALKEEISLNLGLPLYGDANLVFGEGNADAEVLFIGEAPGFHEDRLGRPFVGQAGKLLDKLIAAIGWRREDVYITNIVKRRPPENRDPLPEEIAAYKPFLDEQIKIIKPKIIATLGRFSMNVFLPDAKISRDHGVPKYADGCLIVPLYHPAAALRATAVLKELENDFKRLPEIIKNPPSPSPNVSTDKSKDASPLPWAKKKGPSSAEDFQDKLF
ncbi:MAG: uracil-DNA glycosylase [Patescibacteria group bacterium]